MACSFSGEVRGRPSLTPESLARASPARTRSAIIDRSNSANTPIMPNIALPAAVRVWISDRKPTKSCRLRAEPIDRPGHHHVKLRGGEATKGQRDAAVAAASRAVVVDPPAPGALGGAHGRPAARAGDPRRRAGAHRRQHGRGEPN